MSQYWSDLEQTEYDPEEFVERLAYRARAGGGYHSHQSKEDLSEAEHLYDVFLTAIKDLKLMQEKQTGKCQELEEKVREDEKAHWARVAALIQRNKNAAATYKSLDERINLVAGKVMMMMMIAIMILRIMINLVNNNMMMMTLFPSGCASGRPAGERQHPPGPGRGGAQADEALRRLPGRRDQRESRVHGQGPALRGGRHHPEAPVDRPGGESRDFLT